MKKLFAATLSVLFFTAYSNAQSGMHIGLQLGLNDHLIINQDNYGYSELNYKKFNFGVAPGLAFGYNFTTDYGVQLELNFVQMGQDYTDKVRDFGPVDSLGKPQKVTTNRYINLNYLQIPIMFKYISSGDKIYFHAMGGPVFGLLLSADQYYEADVLNNGNIVKLDYAEVPETKIPVFAATPASEPVKDYFQNTDIGLQLDLGVDLYINDNIYITPALRGYIGFTDINSEPVRIAPVNETYGASHNLYGGINVGIHYMNIDKAKKDKKKKKH